MEARCMVKRLILAVCCLALSGNTADAQACEFE
jgi:hypothetical protein